MMQLDLLDSAYATGPDPDTAAILALMNGDPCHDRDREAIIDAIRASVDSNGTTTANRWRPLIPTWCFPNVVGATVNALTKAHVLEWTGQWEISDDIHGRNSGRPMRVYRLNASAGRHAS